MSPFDSTIDAATPVASAPAERPADRRPRLLAGLIGFAVLFLAAANGIFTHAGALLYVEEPLYALLFAVAVQLAIGATLLALPHIRGFGKLVLLGVYVAALALSTLSAYTYLFNASRPEAAQDINALDTAGKTAIADHLGAALLAEQRHLDQRRVELAQLEREAQEEAARGGYSGKGPGRGPEYLRKIDRFESAGVALATPLANFEQARPLYAALRERLAGPVSLDDRAEIAGRIGEIRALANSDQTAEILSRIVREDLGNLRNPVERALLPLLDPQGLSLNILVSLVWAGIFDLLALFLGIIRYYLLRPERSLLEGLNQAIVDLGTFLLRLRHAGGEARGQFRREQGERAAPLALNSVEMQNFATWLLAGSELSAQPEGDPVEPLRTLVGYIEPLHLADAANGVGIAHRRVDEEPRLKPLMAMLLQHAVFLNRPEGACYLLNSSAEMAQKVLVFLRMGMRGQAAELGFQGMPPLAAPGRA
jgi:hypothetical protein